MYQLHQGDCLERLKELPDNSIDSIVTDPPYGLSFMGKKWDYDVPSVEVWAECLRVLKPGGYLLAFAGTRTQHRMAVRIEDAGFEIRDMIAWVYGSGFPKSLDVSKAIDKAAGVERTDFVPNYSADGRNKGAEPSKGKIHEGDIMQTGFRERNEFKSIPATEAARQWQGWGTALKPALEPITVARKPLVGTVAENVLVHGTGALNIDGCRVEAPEGITGGGCKNGRSPLHMDRDAGECRTHDRATPHNAGRWPANLIHDGSDEVVGLFPQSNGGGSHVKKRGASVHCFGEATNATYTGIADTGSAARFFYCAKASKRDRDEGLDGFEAKRGTVGNKWTDQDYRRGDDAPSVDRRNHHPTVKPTDLMRYLCRLVTPPNGVVLDPFMGSGSTGKAATLEGFQFVGIEREAEYCEIAKARIEHAQQAKQSANDNGAQADLFSGAA